MTKPEPTETPRRCDCSFWPLRSMNSLKNSSNGEPDDGPCCLSSCASFLDSTGLERAEILTTDGSNLAAKSAKSHGGACATATCAGTDAGSAVAGCGARKARPVGTTTPSAPRPDHVVF